MDRHGVLLRIKRLLPFHCLPQFFVSFGERNGTNPGHGFRLPSIWVSRQKVACNSGVSTPYTQAPTVANSRKALHAQRDFIAAGFKRSPSAAGSIALSRYGNAGGLGCRK